MRSASNSNPLNKQQENPDVIWITMPQRGNQRKNTRPEKNYQRQHLQ